MLFHCVGWVLASFSLGKVLIAALNFFYHMVATFLALVLYMYQTTVVCCCRRKDLLRTTIIDDLERKSEAFVQHPDGTVAIVTEMNLMYVLNELDKMDKQKLDTEDQQKVDKIKERVSSIELTTNISASAKERFEKLRRESMAANAV